MVSIVDRISYMERINESLKLKAFHYFLSDKEVNYLSDNVSDLDEQFLKILSSIQTNNKTIFEEIYSQKSKSNPSKDSPAPFVNDDYLIFCLIIGIIKFNIDKTWIKKIISIRNGNAITITFENILNDNYSSKNNLFEVVLVFLDLCKPSSIDNNLLTETYKYITQNTLIESRNDFQLLSAIRAYDLIIYQKEASEGREITLLKKFNQKFKSRIIVLSWILRAGLSYLLVYGAINLSTISPDIVKFFKEKDYVFDLISITGTIGFTVLSNLNTYLKNKSLKLLMRLFGYPKELLETKNNRLTNESI